MAQQNKKNVKKAPSYSADTMMLRMAGGVGLIALGVLMFLAVALGMDGEVFSTLQRVSGGLSGVLAGVLPVFPVWGGVLLLSSSWKKQSVRPLVIAFVIFMLLEMLTTMSIMTSNGVANLWLMDHLQHEMKSAGRDPGYVDFLVRAFELGAGRGMGGGAVGMVLAWPVWKLIGALAGIILSVLGIVGGSLLFFRVDVKGLIGKAKAASAARQEQQKNQQQQISQDQLRWQQEQQRQQQMQMQQPYPPQTPAWQQPVYQPVVPVGPDTATGFAPVAGEQYTQATPQQLEHSRQVYSVDVPQKKKSKKKEGDSIFARKTEEKRARLAPDSVGEKWVNPDLQPDAKQRPAARHDAGQTWDQPDAYAGAKWQSGEDASWHKSEPAPAAQSPVVHAKEEAAEPVQQVMPLVKEKPVRRKQQPKPSWSDEVPWDEDEVAVPVVQMDTPKGAWKPDLKLPPRRERPAREAEPEVIEFPYVFPPASLLNAPKPPAHVNAQQDEVLSRKLEETFRSFKIPSRVQHVTHGPRISRFEIEIGGGINLSKVTALDKNISMNMKVESVRIEAPIPKSDLVGVEVPNEVVVPVTLREVLESAPMQSVKSPLTVALGKDIAGKPIVCDLAKMPHLLIAGTTGSGKSVCINTILNSLVYRTTPKDVRLILIDPKVVELQCYNGIPHLLIPVVSDPHKAAGTLEWAVAEMEERYHQLSRKNVRSIDGYNASLEEGEEPLPRIVIVIDELADLMMVCKKDVEERICRLAQKARAAGIHLVVATQRPSVDVITGLIKANIPSRIAFKVNSNIDSRTILDRIGAEKLLGNGDMLYLPTGTFDPVRVQGCFMTDEEVNRVTDFLRENCHTDYDPNIIEQLDQIQHGFDAPDVISAEDDAPVSSCDNLLQQAIEMTVQDGQTSTSMLQRRLRIGYARAGRLVDEMEKRGIVSQKDAAKPRTCLISREEFEQMKAAGVLEE